MTSWAFLAAGAVSVFTGKALPAPGPGSVDADRWVPVPDELQALGVPELVGRLDEELWEIELAPAGAGGRLLRRHGGWTQETARAFTEACAWRARDQAVRVLARHDRQEQARRLESLTELEAVERWAATVEIDTLPSHAAFAADAAALSAGRRPDAWRSQGSHPGSRQPAAVIAANLAFVVAHGAGLEWAAADGGAGYERGVAAERAWQTAWLTETLGIAGSR